MKTKFFKVLAIAMLSTACTREAITPETEPPTLAAIVGGPTRAEITALPTLDDTWDAYRPLTPPQKYALWQDKLDHCMSQCTDPDEITYLNTLKNEMRVSDFARPFTEVENADFYTIAIQSIGDEDKVYRYMMVLHDIDRPLPPRREIGAGRAQCKCYYSISCSWAHGEYCNDGADCPETNTGCGVFGNYKCTGLCEGSPIDH